MKLQTAELRYIATGYTDGDRGCELCPKCGLRGVIRLVMLRPDGSAAGVVDAGVVCAAYFSGRTVTEIRHEAERADRMRLKALREAYADWSGRRNEWFVNLRTDHLGVAAEHSAIRAFRDSEAFKTAEAEWLRQNPMPKASND